MDDPLRHFANELLRAKAELAKAKNAHADAGRELHDPFLEGDTGGIRCVLDRLDQADRDIERVVARCVAVSLLLGDATQALELARSAGVHAWWEPSADSLSRHSFSGETWQEIEAGNVQAMPEDDAREADWRFPGEAARVVRQSASLTPLHWSLRQQGTYLRLLAASSVGRRVVEERIPRLPLGCLQYFADLFAEVRCPAWWDAVDRVSSSWTESLPEPRRVSARQSNMGCLAALLALLMVPLLCRLPDQLAALAELPIHTFLLLVICMMLFFGLGAVSIACFMAEMTTAQLNAAIAEVRAIAERCHARMEDARSRQPEDWVREYARHD